MFEPPIGKAQRSMHGDVLTAISNGVEMLFKEYWGKGPAQAKTYYKEDLVLWLLRGGCTRLEEIRDVVPSAQERRLTRRSA